MIDNYLEKRKLFRVSCFHDFFYSLIGNKKKIKFKLKNISVTGACIDSKSKLNINDKVNLYFNNERDLFFEGQVVWQRVNTYGILFVLDTPDDLEKISFVMNNIKIDSK